MYRLISILFLGQLLASCTGTKSLTGAITAFDAFQNQIDVAPAFFVNVAADYELTSKEHFNLTGQTCDDLKIPAIQQFKDLPLIEKIKGKKPHVLTYEEYEKKQFDIKNYSIKFLNQYATKMKNKIQRATDFSTGLSYLSTGADIVEEIPVVGAQAKPYSAAAKAIIAVLDKLQDDATADDIMKAASQSQEKLKIIAGNLKTDFSVINRDAAIYLGAWAACRRSKILAMRRPLPGLGPTSPYEYDAAYSASLQQFIEYKKAIPSVDNELDAFIEANGKIAKGDFKIALAGAQELVAAANATYKAVQSLPPGSQHRE